MQALVAAADVRHRDRSPRVGRGERAVGAFHGEALHVGGERHEVDGPAEDPGKPLGRLGFADDDLTTDREGLRRESAGEL